MKKYSIVWFLFLLSGMLIFTGCTKKHAGIVDESDISMFAEKQDIMMNNEDIVLKAWYVEPIKPLHGKEFTVHTYWVFRKPLSDDYKMFFHFEDESGNERFVHDKDFLDGKITMSETATGKIIHDKAVIPEMPETFDTDNMHIYTGFFSGKKRTVPEKEHNDGKNRLVLGSVKTDKPNVLRKSIKAMAIKGESRKQIKIDGVLDESFWSNTSRGTNFSQTSGKRKAPLETAVMTAIDDKYLYVAFEMEDNDIVATQTEDDSPIYETDDVVEVFIDAAGDRKAYFEMQVSAAGVKFDSSFRGQRKNRDDSWNSKMKYAVKIDGKLNDSSENDRGWTVEMAIPFESITDAPNIPPADGDIWKVFFYRINRHSDKKSTSEDFMAWTPPYSGDFHNLKFMGDLVFSYELIK